MILRPYQLDAVDAVWDMLSQFSSTLLVLPTGTGKTVIFSHVAARCTKRVLVLAHRQELIFQARNTMQIVMGEPPEIEMGSMRADNDMFRRAKVVIASKDTMHKHRLERFDPDQFGLVITDEAHHGTAASYTRVYDHFKHVPHVGVTATPDRTDKQALGRIFESVAFEYSISEAIRDGWLVPIMQHSVKVEGLDFSGIKKTAGDLNMGELSRVMQFERTLHAVADPTVELAGDKKTLIFAVSVEHAERLAEIINRQRPGKAKMVCGGTPREERAMIIKQFEQGEIQFLVNVGVFTEGFDSPGIEMVVMARKTMSRSLYAQMVGRGTRPLAGLVDQYDSSGKRVDAIRFSAKPELVVLDFVGNSGRHKLVSCADILGGDYDENVVQLAERNMQQSGIDADVVDELKKAERQIAMERRRKEAADKRTALIGKAKYSTVVVNAFNVLDIAPPPEIPSHKGRDPSDAMVATLAKRGVKDPGSMTYTQAGRMIGELNSRREKGLCSYKQMALLKKFRIDPANITFKDASKKIDAIAKNGWRVPV